MSTTRSTSISDAQEFASDTLDAVNSGVDTAQTVVKRAVQGAHAAVDSVARKVESAVDRFKSGASSTTASVEEGVNQIAEVERAMLGTVRTTVRDHPLLAIGLALAAGVLISRVVSSR